MKTSKHIALIILPFVILVGFVLLTDPYQLPLVLLLVPYFLLGFGVFKMIFEIFSHTPIAPKKGRYIAGVVTTVILLVVLMQSIRQLSPKDILILITFLSGLTFYMRRIEI